MKVTAEDVAQLLGSAPRQVPPHVARAAAGICVPWSVGIFGLIFGSLGLFFVLLFFPWRFRDDWRLAGEETRTTSGIVQAATKTNLSINKVKVIEYVFAYTPEDQHRREGRCFTTGRKWDRGAEVTVRYLPENPDLACIAGARVSQTDWGGSFVVIFPMLGFVFITWFSVDRYRTRWLLYHGLVAEADVISVEKTATTANNQNVYKIVVAGSALHDGRPITLRRLNRRETKLADQRCRKKQPLFVLYHPRRKRQMLFPEALIDVDA